MTKFQKIQCVENVIESSKDKYKDNRGRGNALIKRVTYADVVKGKHKDKDETAKGK